MKKKTMVITGISLLVYSAILVGTTASLMYNWHTKETRKQSDGLKKMAKEYYSKSKDMEGTIRLYDIDWKIQKVETLGNTYKATEAGLEDCVAEEGKKLVRISFEITNSKSEKTSLTVPNATSFNSFDPGDSFFSHQVYTRNRQVSDSMHANFFCTSKGVVKEGEGAMSEMLYEPFEKPYEIDAQKTLNLSVVYEIPQDENKFKVQISDFRPREGGAWGADYFEYFDVVLK